MLVAVPYANGEIYSHFGKAPQFKIYNVKDGEVVESFVIDTVGAGHAALADFLKKQNINVVIAGGIGNPAVLALAANGIDVVPGIEGNPDQALRDLLDGTLVAGAVGCGCGCGEAEKEGDTCVCDAHAELTGEGCGCSTQKEDSKEACSIDEGSKGCGCGCSTKK
ncbi:MAG: NifB/NifX family molybdenum-iron cluster-binding protein [Burkholderiales bacterium]|nr:NifB/NifX family molybdenum-iron cluster-binding protein [Burkholderiales bacterium]